ncbi:MAG: hypothetical protein M3Q97_01690, partial [Bacteroidota bacterium]|nr:hypothetical protein [Bacteroidota bacterium]
MKIWNCIPLLALALFASCCQDPECADRDLGRLPFNDSCLQWIPHDSPKTMVFMNSKGDSLKFLTGKNTDTVVSGRVINGADCGGNCWDNFTARELRLDCQPAADTLPMIKYAVSNYVPENYLPGGDGTNLVNILILSLGDYFWHLPLQKLPAGQEIDNAYKFLSTIHIGGRQFMDVHFADHAPYTVNPGKAIPQAVAYNQKDGILGFYFSNG